MYIRVPCQLNGELTVLQPFRRIAISLLPGTQVKHLGLSALSMDTTSKQYPNIEKHRYSNEAERANKEIFHVMLNPYSVELFVSIFRHLKLELRTQFPSSNDEKHFFL